MWLNLHNIIIILESCSYLFTAALTGSEKLEKNGSRPDLNRCARSTLLGLGGLSKVLVEKLTSL